MRHALALLTCALLPAAGAPEVAVVRRVVTRPTQWETQAGVDGFIQILRERLTALGIEHAVIDDAGLTAARLAPYKIALLPHNPGTPDEVVAALEEYVAGGGRLGLFYASNPRLLRLVGLTGSVYLGQERQADFGRVAFVPGVLPGAPTYLAQRSWNIQAPQTAPGGATVAARWESVDGQPTEIPALTVHATGFAFCHVLLGEDGPGGEQLLLALLGQAVPGIWQAAIERRLERVGRVGPYADLAALAAALGESAGAATAARQRALQLRDAGDLAGAFAAAGEAIDAGRAAFLAHVPSREREFRAAWIHDAYGIAGWGWDRTVKALADAGFTAIIPNMCWGAVADYPSAVLPVHPRVATEGDQIALCLAACRKYGLECHIWRVNWNMGHHTPEAIRQAMTAAGRTQIDYRGQPSNYLAPHLAVNFELEREAMLEIVRKYPVDGIHFDYIRYPGPDCDFSDSARQAFETWLGEPVDDWPAACHRGRLTARWNEWRRSHISRLVEAVHAGAKAIRPDIQISAAVFADWDTSLDTVAQHVERWLDEGWLDFVCPMDYTPDDATLRRWVTRQATTVAGRVPLYIGLGSFRHASPAETAAQIELTRELAADGFVMFEHNRRFAEVWLPGLRQGATSRPAGPAPHRQPRLRWAVRGGETSLRPVVHHVGQPVTVRVEPPAGVSLPATGWRLTRDGRPTDLPVRVTGGELTFTPEGPGWYRIEGEPGRSGPVVVLAEAEITERLTRQGPPRFAGGGLKVAVWHDAYGSVPLLAALAGVAGFDVAPLYNFKPDSLAAAEVVLLPQPRRDFNLFRDPATVAAVRRYLEGGGGALTTHALVGLRGLPSYAPEIAEGDETVGGRGWQIVGEHPAGRGVAAGVRQQTFGDRITLKLGPAATVVATTPDGRPVIAAGEVGRGRYIACGLGLAIGSNDADTPPSGDELTWLTAALRWLGRR